MVLRGYLGPTVNELHAHKICERITEIRYRGTATRNDATIAIRNIVYGLEEMGKIGLKRVLVKELKVHHKDVCPAYCLV